MFQRILGLTLFLIAAGPAAVQGQVLQVESASLSHGATNVPLSTSVSITFNQSFGSAAEADAYVVWYGEYAPGGEPATQPVLSEDGRTVTYTITHLPDRDYLWLVHGYLDTGGGDVFETQPFVLHYTTGSVLGPYSIGGTVTASTSPPPSKTAVPEPENAVIFLFGSNPHDIRNVVGAAVTDAEGYYEIQYVKPGSHIVMAQKIDYSAATYFAPPLYLGAYGANADATADPLVIESASRTDINIEIRPSSVYTAGEAEAEASARAAAEAFSQVTDLELIGLSGLEWSVPDNAVLSGEFPFWTFYYHSATTDKIYTGVRQGFLNFVNVYGSGLPEGHRTIPDSYTNSMDLVSLLKGDPDIAAFLATHQGGDLTASIAGGDPAAPDAPYPDHLLWTVIVTDWAPEPNAQLLAYVDMTTGDVLEVKTTGSGSPVPNEPENGPSGEIALYRNYPNPFSFTTTIPFSTRSGGHVTINVYDVLGREVATPADGVFPAGTQRTMWEARGLPAGVYFVRLTAGSTTRSMAVVLRK